MTEPIAVSDPPVAWHLQAPRAAYVHVPFCARRCGYCNFTLLAGRDDLIGDYLAALEIELRRLEHPREVETLFLGGGTPTHLPPEDLNRLLAMVAEWFPLAEGYEWSVEANPADLSSEKVAILADCGVNRISVGTQSFDADKLSVLERDHTGEEVELAFEVTRQQIENVSLDLIFGAPGETLEGWQGDLKRAIALAPSHISTYGLTIERGAMFYNRWLHGTLAKVDEELERAMYVEAIDILGAAGYEHYEVSNFARPGGRCRHNETYWAGLPYFAAGPGAARYVDGRREVNHRGTLRWIQLLREGGSPVAESETLDAEDRAREAAVLSLRTMDGLDRDQFQSRTGFNFDELLGAETASLVRQGLLQDDGDRVRLTREGLLVSDAIWSRFLRV